MAIPRAEKRGQIAFNGHKTGEVIGPNVPLTVLLEDETAKKVEIVGGKAASLAELNIIPGIKVPEAFVVTTSLQDQVFAQNPEIRAKVESLDEVTSLWLKAKLIGDNEGAEGWEGRISLLSKMLEEMMRNVRLPTQAKNQIGRDYDKLCERVGEENMAVAVRSSGTSEDGKDNSFAGQHKTLLHQRGKEKIIDAAKECLASQFSERAVNYRNEGRFEASKKALMEDTEDLDRALKASEQLSHKESKLAVIVQRMVNAKAAGVGFSIDPNSGARLTHVDVSYGLGEAVVSGSVTPDSYDIDPNTGEIIGRNLGEKAIKIVYAEEGTKEDDVSKQDRKRFAISDAQVKEIAASIDVIRKAYRKEVDDMEFAIDAEGRLYFLQARPETVVSNGDSMIVKMRSHIIPEDISKNAKEIFKGGETGSPGAASGIMAAVATIEEAKQIIEEYKRKGEKIILVTDRTDPDWVPIMKKVSGIITRVGGATCHAAIVSRELGVPCIVGAGGKIESLAIHAGSAITMDASGKVVYEGTLALEEIGEDIDVRELLENPTKTVIGINIANIDQARKLHPLAELGEKFKISLLRTEFLLEDIGVHVNALVDFDKGKIAPDSDLYRRIAEKIAGYGSGEEYFKTKLTEGIAAFAAAFPNSSITLRTTDFKTNEYKSLIGGKEYEPEESNPMLGDRGLLRFLRPENRDAFKWELEAIKKVREMGYKNVEVMFPMVHDPKELTGDPELTAIGFKGAFETMDEVGMSPGKDGLRVGIMVEIPSNAIRILDFIKAGIQFVSIGSNDLTQFGLAVDRDNEKMKLSWLSAANPAVVKMIEETIEVCDEFGIDVGICGQEPSNNPGFARKLVEFGIKSMGVTPDTFLRSHRLVREAEKSRNSHAAPTSTVLFTAS